MNYSAVCAEKSQAAIHDRRINGALHGRGRSEFNARASGRLRGILF